ncbi:MAG: type II and III secretion system protein family protein, partial [Sphingomicrobium sp.]
KMNAFKIDSRTRLGTAVVAAALALGTLGGAASASAQPAAYASGTYRPTKQVTLSVGEGQMVNLPRSVTSVWTSNPKVADVYVNSPRQINLFGKDAGAATIIATAADGTVVYGADIQVSQNLGSVNDVLRQAMPDSNVSVTTIGQIAIINGTVANPEDATQAQQIVRAMLNPGIKEGDPLLVVPVNRLKVATPLQVTLKVRIAEINRSVIKRMGINLLATDPTSGFKFGVAQGQGIYLPNPADPKGVPTVLRSLLGSTFSGSGKFLGLDLLASLDIAAQDGLVSILAEPNLTAVTGETASFLAGGEFPIPVSEGLGSVSIIYKSYGVGLAFTPIVLGDGRISMRVRPEVSELSNEGAITLNGFNVPALTTRRAETTVELGSGQSFMIAGLLRNSSSNSVDKAPFLGDIPILGALFRSTNYRKQETELVVIVTPYLVRPVSGQMAASTDGYRTPDDGSRDFLGQTYQGVSGSVQPQAIAAPPATVAAPVAGAVAPGFKL